MKKTTKIILKKIEYIIYKIIEGVGYALIPTGIMYAAHQTTASYIKKYELGSSKLETALEMTKKVDIVCGIILGIIAIWVIYNIIKCVIGKVDLDMNSGKSYSNYSGEYTSSSYNNGQIKVETNIFGERIYKDSTGNAFAKGETNIFGEEIIKKL